jgi:hypothetical protein
VDEDRFDSLWAFETSQNYDEVYDEGENLTRPLQFILPPEEINTWNQNEVYRFPVGGASQSIAPPHASFTSSQREWIDDAHATIFSITPSTDAHISGDEPTFYVGDEGYLAGVVDYTLHIPPDEESEERRVEYEVLTQTIETEIYADGTRLNREGNAGHHSVLTFDEMPANVDEMRFDATITVIVEKTVYTRDCSDDDDDDSDDGDGSNGDDSGSTASSSDSDGEDCTPWEKTDEEEIEERAEPSDSMSVEYYDAEEILEGGEVGEVSDEEIRITLDTNTDTPWPMLILPDQAAVRTRWSFFSARDRQWDELQAVSRGATVDELDSPALPLQAHAFPTQRETRFREPIGGFETLGGEMLNVESQSTAAPEKPADELRLNWTDSSYDQTDEVSFSYEMPIEETENALFYGLVYGQVANVSMSELDIFEVRDSFITAEVIDQNRTHMTVNVMLSDDQGRRVNTLVNTGYITVGNQFAETGPTGQVTVTVPREAGTVVEFIPPGHWVEDNTPWIRGSSTVVSPSFNFDIPWAVVGLIILMFVFWTPVYFVDQIFDTDYWPPWRQIR